MAYETGTKVGPDQSQPSLYEIISSEREWSYAAGWVGQIIYKIQMDSWADGNDFVDTIGTTSFPACGASNGKKLFPQSIKIVPWANDTPPNADGAPTIARAALHFATDFLDFAWPNDLTRPGYAGLNSTLGEGTTLKMTENFSGQFLTMPAGSLVWPDKSLFNASQGVYIPVQEFHIEWGRVRDLATMDLGQYENTINSQTFLGYPIGCLLCETAQRQPDYVINSTDYTAWKTCVVFKGRKIPNPNYIPYGDAPQYYGWPYFYHNSATPGFELVTKSDGSPLFPSVDFTPMFNPDQSDGSFS